MILESYGLDKSIIDHSRSVALLATRIADQMALDGVKLDSRVVEAAAILHDIGLTKSGGIEHCVAGAEIVRQLGLPNSVADCIERHECITKQETKELGFRDTYCDRDLVPVTVEDKILVCADNLYWIMAKGIDPLNFSAIVDFLYEYFDSVYEKATGHGIKRNHPAVERNIKIIHEFQKYLCCVSP